MYAPVGRSARRMGREAIPPWPMAKTGTPAPKPVGRNDRTIVSELEARRGGKAAGGKRQPGLERAGGLRAAARSRHLVGNTNSRVAMLCLCIAEAK